MEFKISDTNKGKNSLIYDGFIYRIDGVLKGSNCDLKSKGKQRTIVIFSMVLITRYDYSMSNLSK